LQIVQAPAVFTDYGTWVSGDECLWIPDVAGSTAWHMRYNGTNWIYLGGPPWRVSVAQLIGKSLTTTYLALTEAELTFPKTGLWSVEAGTTMIATSGLAASLASLTVTMRVATAFVFTGNQTPRTGTDSINRSLHTFSRHAAYNVAALPATLRLEAAAAGAVTMNFYDLTVAMTPRQVTNV
jgi:hypothetical protein